MLQEETRGLINGLAAVAKEQNASNKSRAKELKSLASAVKDLSDLIKLQSQASPGHAALRLPNLHCLNILELKILTVFWTSSSRFSDLLMQIQCFIKHTQTTVTKG